MTSLHPGELTLAAFYGVAVLTVYAASLGFIAQHWGNSAFWPLHLLSASIIGIMIRLHCG